MRNIALIGLQVGDEGKGVRTGYFIKKAIDNSWIDEISHPVVLVERFQGGANAGHIVVIGGERYAHHQVPSGITFSGTYNLIGEGTLFNPRLGMAEIKELQKRGFKITPENLGIASNAHVTLDYHTEESIVEFNEEKRACTGKGIKQTAVDKFGRVGIRFQEFLDRNSFIEILKENRFSDGQVPNGFKTLEDFVDSYEKEREFLNGFSILQTDATNNKIFSYRIGEGAQGYILDVDKGLYPGVTSSNSAVVPFKTDVLLGVVKMYKSSTGANRPFVGQMPAGLEKYLRGLWNENGTTTGKPRDLGPIDIVELKHAVRDTNVDYLIGTRGDSMEVLAAMGEKVRLIVGYQIEGKVYTDWDKSFHNRKTLYKAKPVFEEFEPWDTFFDLDKRKLTDNARKYIDRIQELTGKEFVLHGYGADVDDVYEVKNIFELSALKI